MKTLATIALALAGAVVVSGCSTTNDHGVNVSHPYDIFGAVPGTPAPATATANARPTTAQPTPAAQPA